MSNTSSPSVLFVDQTGELGGAELSLLDIISRRARSDQVILFSDGPFQLALEKAGVLVDTILLGAKINKSSGIASQFSALGSVAVAAYQLAKRASKFDVIYANTQKSAVIGSLAACLARRPMIWHLRDILSTSHFSRANLRAVIALTNKFTSQIIANSEHTARAYRKAGGRKQVRVIHNGIATQSFGSIASNETLRIRAEAGVPPSACLVGVFGRLTPWKGQHILLRALNDPSCQDVHAIVVGEALFTDDDTRYASQLREEAREPPLEGRVQFLGHRQDVPDLMNACDIVVHCSVEDEPFGRVIVEGMLAGKPVIASRGGGATEIIHHKKTGVLTTPGDAEELASAIHQLIDNPQEAREIAAAGHADAVKRFDVDDRVADINAVIAEVASQAG